MNACETAAGLLPGYWQHELDADERAGDRLWLHQHLAGCPECTAMAALWERLGELPAARPDPRQRQRFDEMLAAWQQGLEAAAPVNGAARPARRPPGWAGLVWRPLPALAAAALLVLGVAAGWMARGSAAPAASTSEASQLADLRQEVQSTRQLAVLSLLQQRSASDRLQGVSYGAPIVGADPQVTAALLNSIKYDPSPDVRLAALDALDRHVALPAVQSGLIAAFPYQTSPLLQVALVDSFIQSRDPQARALLQQVSQGKNYNPEVRQRAAWGLAQPTWN